MASITDCVVEGLKYPLRDVKKLFSFGALFVIINVMVFAILEKSIGLVRIISITDGSNLALKLSHLPSADICLITGLTIVCFIVSLIIMGYEYNVMKFSIDRKNDLPGFSVVLNLIINGVKYLVVSLIYSIIPTLVFVVGVELFNNDYIVSIISIILYIICYFLLIMGLANMVDSGKFTKAFAFGEITDKIANLGWVKYIGIILFTLIVYAIIMVAVGIILMFISAVFAVAIGNAMVLATIISVIEGLFISSYITIFFNRVFGSVYRESIK